MLNNKGYTVIELLIVLAVLGLVATVVGVSAYGIYLAFSASVLLGVVVLFVEPLPFVIGIVWLLTGTDIAQRILELFR